MTKNLPYKSPAVLNLDPKDLDNPNRLYVFPVFIKNGKHDVVFRYEDFILGSVDWHMKTEIVDQRQEDIAYYTKPLKSLSEERRFVKENSVFNEWKQDNQASITKCLDHDF